MIVHGIPHLTIIATNQSVFNTIRPPLLSQCNVTVNTIQLPGPGTRRQERKISLDPNNSSVSLKTKLIVFYLLLFTENSISKLDTLMNLIVVLGLRLVGERRWRTVCVGAGRKS